jgi:CheY-like chemotaxis protein
MTFSLMLVDDSEAFADIVADSLSVTGFEIHRAKDGAEALAALLAQPREWFALITDQRMPRMGGMELIREVMAQGISVQHYVLMSSNFEYDAKLNTFLEEARQVDLRLVEKSEYGQLREILGLRRPAAEAAVGGV